MSTLFSSASSTASWREISSLPSWMSCSTRGELATLVSSILIARYGAIRFGNGLGARVKLCFAEPSDTGIGAAVVFAGGAGGGCWGSCARAGEAGPPASVMASTAANSGRANSDPDWIGVTLGEVIALLTLKISPKGLNLY